MPTNFPETTAGDDEGVVQGNESALASDAVTDSGIVSIPDELCPVTVDDGSPGLEERVLDGTKESRARVEIRKIHGFQFESLSGEVGVDELFDCAFSKASPIDGSEICKDLTGRFIGWFIGEGF